MNPVASRLNPSPLLSGLPPLVRPDCRLLILGSFPGAASLAAGQYYAHPQNQFWKILAALWPDAPTGTDYPARCAWLLERRLGLWDVYGACERQGSLDSAIRNAQVNDFVALHRRLPALVAIAHNGGESHKHARHTAALGLPVYRLPSTSPANASWSFDAKLAAWREVMLARDLI